MKPCSVIAGRPRLYWFYDQRELQLFRKEGIRFISTFNMPLHALWNCVYEDPDQIIWIGTSKGLIRFDPETTDTTDFSHIPGLRGLSVNSVLSDRNGSLWLGTSNGQRLEGKNFGGFENQHFRLPFFLS